jgi:hypothetical protein
MPATSNVRMAALGAVILRFHGVANLWTGMTKLVDLWERQ